MTGLLGVALFYAVATSTIDISDAPTSHLDNLNSLVVVIKATQQEDLGIYNPLIKAICHGNYQEVNNLKESPYMTQKVQGLYPIHWAVIAKQDDIYDFFAKEPDNLKLRTTDGLLPFELSIKYKAWDQEQIQKREDQDHYRNTYEVKF